MNEFFNDIMFITEFGGYDIFKMVAQEPQLLFYTNGRKSDAKGVYDENGFTVLKGSIIAANAVKSHINPIKRTEILNKTSEIQGEQIILKQNYIFLRPSVVADFCIGSSNNGWLIWKTKAGNTLDELFRK